MIIPIRSALLIHSSEKMIYSYLIVVSNANINVSRQIFMNPLSVVSVICKEELTKNTDNNPCYRSIVMGIGGFHKNVMRLQPPLSITREQL